MQEARVIGYVRIAPRERPGSRPGLSAQRAAVEAECERRAWRLVGFEQDVRSGRTLRRPGLARAFASCRDGRADAIVVARLDRLTYSLVDLAHIVAEARDAGINLVAPDLDVDLSTREGAHLAHVLAAAAGWSERPLAWARSAFAGHLPHEPRRRGRPSSTPNDLADRIRSLRAAGKTLQAICDLLNAEGVPTPRGGTTWRPSSLRAILRPLRVSSAEGSEGRTA